MSNLKVIEKQITVKYVSIGNVEILLGSLMDMLDELEGTNALFTGVVIYDSELRKELEERGVVHTNIRGGSGEGENFKDLYNEVYELVYGEKP